MVVNQRNGECLIKIIWKLCIRRLHCWGGRTYCCNGRPEDSDFDNSRKKRARCNRPLTRHDDREVQINELVDELREMHGENHPLSFMMSPPSMP